MNADGTNSFLSNNREQYIKSPNGCQNFHLRRQEGSDPSHFELVSACALSEERIEPNGGTFHTFRLTDAPLIYYFVSLPQNSVENTLSILGTNDVAELDSSNDKEFGAPVEVRLERDIEGKAHLQQKGYFKNLCIDPTTSHLKWKSSVENNQHNGLCISIDRKLKVYG